MSSRADLALVDRRSSRAPVRFEPLVFISTLVAVLSFFMPLTSSAAELPPLSLSLSPSLRTAHTRSTLLPQSSTGWYYAEDSRHWYYRLPDSSSSRKTGWHHDVDGFSYYFDPTDGHMLSGAHQIDGIEYRFLPERDRGNYHQDARGAWFYQPNGLAPYGSLLSSHSRDGHKTSPAAARPDGADRDPAIIDSSEIVTDRITIPPKASPSEVEREETVASPSELPPPEDERLHRHTEDPSVRCIATDDWPTILAHRDAYRDCIEQHCTARLALCGPAISWPLPSTESRAAHYPLYVSLVDDRDGKLSFAQAYAIPELRSVPMYVGTSAYPDTDGSTVYKQTNRGGLLATWLFQLLNGSRNGKELSFYLEEDGRPEPYRFSYPGYTIRIPDGTGAGGDVLPLEKSVKRISQGYQLEDTKLSRTKYQNYLSGKQPKESKLTQLCSEKQSRAALWFPSAQELHDYTLPEAGTELDPALDEDGAPLLSMYLRSEHCLPALVGSWRSAEAYWLRSTPSAYAREAVCDELGLSSESRAAVPLEEYFLQADADGSIHAAHYDERAAVRLIFTVGE